MEKRQYKRVHFFQRVQADAAGVSYETFCLDISLRGVLLVLPEGAQWGNGDKVKIIFHLADGQTIIMACTIVHLDDDVVGCSCDMMDADGISALKHLLEVNLEIPSQADRDMDQMINPG